MTELFAAEHEGHEKPNADPLAAIDETFSDWTDHDVFADPLPSGDAHERRT